MKYARPVALVLLISLAITLGYVVAGPSADPSVRRSAWTDLLRNDQFDQLESEIRAVAEESATGDCGECAAEKAYQDFATSDPLIGQKLDQWIAVHPDSAPAHLARGLYREHLSWLARGTAYASDTQPEQLAEMARLQSGALEDLTWVVKRDERSPSAFAALIDISMTRADAATVAQVYAQAIAANPGSPTIYQRRAWSLSPWWQGVLPWPEAFERQRAFVADLHQRFAGQPGFEWLGGYADYMHAEALLRTGDLDGAIAGYTKALQAREAAGYLLARATAYRNLRQYALEASDLERAFEINPDNEDVLFRVATLRADQCQEVTAKNGDAATICAAASTLLDAAVHRDPLNPEYLVARAAHLVLIGDIDAARRDVDSAEAYGWYDPSVQDSIGEMLANVDRPDAKAAYRRAAGLAPRELYYFTRYMDFLAIAGDCEYLTQIPVYRAACQGDKTCGLDSDDESIASMFQNMRGRSCASETWHEPQSSFVMPD